MTMKLSEAIRLGAMLRPQAFHTEYDDEGSCAIGAAFEAVGLRSFLEAGLKDDQDPWVWSNHTFARCPACNKRDEVTSLIQELNDGHRWTREAIADWVEIIENAQPAPVKVQPEEAVCAK